jgi:alpha-glucoside transport system substrate-binding protein
MKKFSSGKFLLVLVVALILIISVSCTTTSSPTAGTTAPTIAKTSLPVPSAAPSITAAPSVSASPLVSAKPSASASPSAVASPSVSAKPSASASPSAVASPSVSAKPSASASPSAVASPSPSASPGGVLPLPSATAAQAIGNVEVLGVWGSSEQDSFMAMVAPWQQTTGGKVNFTGTRDLNAVLQTRIQAGNLPDIAILPNPGAVKSFASSLKPLGPMLNLSNINQQYSNDWLGTGTVNGNLLALPIKATNKGIIWYNPKTFTANGWQIPKTWDEMISLSDTIATAKKTPAYPWSVGVEAGQASGFPATDWMAQIFLSKYGGAAYDQWVNHQIPWTDSRIKDAWNLFGTTIVNSNYVAGGAPAVLATNFQAASYLPFNSPPKAALYYEGDFVQGFLLSQFTSLVPGVDFNFFPFPALAPLASVLPGASASPGASVSASPSASPSVSSTPAASVSASPSGSPLPTITLSATAITTGADLIVAFKDNPTIRSFINYMSTPQAQTIWVKRGGFTSVNKQVNLSDYPDPIARQSAQLLVNAPISRFGAGDSMPPLMQTSWWQATMQFLQGGTTLDAILANLENTAKTAYAASPGASGSPSASPSASPSPTASRTP